MQAGRTGNKNEVTPNICVKAPELHTYNDGQGCEYMYVPYDAQCSIVRLWIVFVCVAAPHSTTFVVEISVREAHFAQFYVCVCVARTTIIPMPLALLCLVMILRRVFRCKPSHRVQCDFVCFRFTFTAVDIRDSSSSSM